MSIIMCQPNCFLVCSGIPNSLVSSSPPNKTQNHSVVCVLPTIAIYLWSKKKSMYKEICTPSFVEIKKERKWPCSPQNCKNVFMDPSLTFTFMSIFDIDIDIRSHAYIHMKMGYSILLLCKSATL